MKVVVIGNFTTGNAGDNAILESVVNDINHYMSSPEIIVSGKEYIQLNSPKNIKFISISPKKLALGFFSLKLIKEMNDADIVLMTAGMIFARKLWNWNYSLMATFMPAYIISSFGKKHKLIAYNAGITLDGNLLANIIVKSFLNKCALISFRHNEDYMNVQNNQVKKIKSLDNIFAYGEPTRKSNNEKKIIGINIASYTVIKIKDYKKFVIDFIDNISTFFQGEKIIIYQTTYSDTQFIRKLLSANKKEYEVVDLSLYYYQDIIRHFDNVHLFLGMRMHSLIFSMKTSTPLIGIAYDRKVKSLFTDLNLEQYVVDLSSETISNVIDLSSYIKDHYDLISELIYEKSTEANKLVSRNNDAIWNTFL